MAVGTVARESNPLRGTTQRQAAGAASTTRGSVGERARLAPLGRRRGSRAATPPLAATAASHRRCEEHADATALASPHRQMREAPTDPASLRSIRRLGVAA